MKLEELYAKYHSVLTGKMNVSPIEDFLFDLADENSQGSLKAAFPGIEAVLMPECGKYLVVTTIVEDPDCLLLLFPEQTDGNLSLKVFDTTTGRNCDLVDQIPADAPKLTIDNFYDFANIEGITTRFNEFVFSSEGEDSTEEVKDIGSVDITHDEPVEMPTTTTDNEETKMNKPIEEETELDRETKWVEIPNTNAGGVTVTEDEENAGDPAVDPNAPAPEGDAAAAVDAPVDAPAEPAAEPAPEEAPAEPAAEPAPAEEPAPVEEPAPAAEPTIDDPKAKMRELLAYYTNYMTELVNDPNTSTELISATQDMIDSLIKNMESADGIEEVKADQEEAAKEEVAATDAPAEETPAEEPPAEEPVTEAADEPATDETEPAAEPAADDEQAAVDAKIDAEIDDLHKDDLENIEPATSDNILTPGDLANSPVNDVDLSGVAPTPEEELAATTPDETIAPTSDVLDDTALPSPDEEVSLLGADDAAMVGADGLPLDTFDGDIDAIGTVPAAKKIAWSTDYATNGIATTDDSTFVVPEVLNELSEYYKKVADEVSKVPGKEDVAMKLQKIQILSQTIANEWGSVLGQIGGQDSYDLSNMGDLEKDELATIDAFNQVGADVMADQEKEEEDELAINNEIASFVEAFKHLM